MQMFYLNAECLSYFEDTIFNNNESPPSLYINNINGGIMKNFDHIPRNEKNIILWVDKLWV